MPKKKPRRRSPRLADFKPSSWNPREISAESRAALAESLRVFGDLSRFVVNRRGSRYSIICGHQRRSCLEDIELVDVEFGPKRRVELGQAGKRFVSTERDGFVALPDGARFRVREVSWPKAFERAANVAANSPMLAGDFTEGLAGILAEVAEAEPDLSDALLFPELLAGLGLISTEKVGGLTDPDAVPKPPAKATTRAGDIYTLPRPSGPPHRLTCGDATSTADMARVLGSVTPDQCFTDPPYNMDYKSKALGGIKNDAISEAKFIRLVLGSLSCVKECLRSGATFYVCMSGTGYATVAHQLRKLGLAHRPLIWVKPYTGMGYQDYRPQFEVIVYGVLGDRRSRTWTGQRSETDVWEFGASDMVVARETEGDGMALEFGVGHDTVQVLLDQKSAGSVIEFNGATSDVWRFSRPRGEYVHPTQKPVALVERALTNSSKAGDVVFDPFAGSGSTLIAAEQLGRRAFLMELDPLYCDVIVKRWEEFTGRKAKRIPARKTKGKK